MMRLAFPALGLVMLSACAATPVAPPPAPEPVALVSPPAAESPGRAPLEIGRRSGNLEQRLDLRVERLWTENGLTHASVVVRNTAAFDLVKVTVRCLGLGAGETPLGVGETTIFGPEEGRLSPGGARTTQISLRTPGVVQGMACEARAL